jgi:predicted transcriptional regulator
MSKENKPGKNDLSGFPIRGHSSHPDTSIQGYRPFGPDGPLVRIIPRSEIPKEGSDLTYEGLRILKAVPVEKGSTIGIRTLADNLNALGDYAGYESNVNELVTHGYLKRNKRTNQLSLTRKGLKELPEVVE